MVRFTLKQLSYFSAVAQHGGIAQAARALNISQPAVASALDKLEDLMGLKLFERRHSQGAALTPQGREALMRARHLLRAAVGAEREFQAIAAEVMGHVRVGFFATLAPFYAPGLIVAMRRRYPSVEIELVEGRHDQIVAALDERSIDVALIYAMDLDARALDWEIVKTLPPYVILPHDHPLANEDPISLAALADEPYVMFDWPATRQYFASVLNSAGIEPEIAFRSQSYEVVRGAVGSGLGFSLLAARPKADVTYDGQPLACRRIREPVPSLDIVLAWSRNTERSALRESFLRICHEYFATTGRPASGR